MPDMTPAQAIGQNLELARKFSGVQVDAIVIETGLSRQMLRRYETGESTPSSATLLDWSKLTGFSVGALMDERHAIWSRVTQIVDDQRQAQILRRRMETLSRKLEKMEDLL